MASQDLYSFISPAIALNYTNPTANGTGLSNVIDLAQFESALFVVNNQFASGTTTVAYELRSGNATDALTAVANENLIGLETDLALSSSTGTQGAKKLGYVGDDRYVALHYTATSVQTGAGFNAVCLRGAPVNLQV